MKPTLWQRLFGARPQAATGVSSLPPSSPSFADFALLTDPEGAMRRVTPDTAMRASAVYGCVALIAGAITSLPLPILRRVNGDSPEPADHPYWWLLNERPHPTMSASAFWEYITASMLLRGDGFAEILRPNRYTNEVKGLLPWHPARVEVEQYDGEVVYLVTPSSGQRRVVAAADMLHFPTLGFDGLRSPSPISLAGRTAVGIALAADEHSKSFFDNKARPDIVLSTEKKLDAEQIKLLRDAWMSAYGGASRSGMPAVIGGGMTLEPITVSGDDAQLLESRKFQVEEICRIFGVPPFMLGHTEKTTSWGQGVDNMGRGFVKFTLRRHLEKIEQELNYKFWPARERYFVEFMTAGLEQGDYKTRTEGYRVALGRAGEPGWMTVNEVRRLENLPRMDSGDELNTGIQPAGNPDEKPPAQPAGE
jgi:HK97 family phage portal protein